MVRVEARFNLFALSSRIPLSILGLQALLPLLSQCGLHLGELQDSDNAFIS